MGRIADDLGRLVDEIQTMNEARDSFIKEIQTAVKQKADETRQFVANFKNEMNCAHEAFFSRKASRKR